MKSRFRKGRYQKKRKAVRRTGGKARRFKRSAKTTRRVKGRTFVAGVTEKHKKITELKWMDYKQATPRTIRDFSAGANMIWSTDSTLYDEEAKAQPFNPQPGQGISNDNQYIGTQWNYSSVDLRFLINPMQQTQYNNNLFRLFVLKNKFNDEAPGLSNLPSQFNEPIKTKLWDVIMDKTFSMNNGYGAVDANVPAAGQTNQIKGNIRSHIKSIRMVIPYRVQATLNGLSLNFKSMKNIYVMIFSLNTCTDFFIQSTFARVYFTDP